jgi:hypothetical protein
MLENGLLRLMKLLADKSFTHDSRSMDEIEEKKYDMSA